MFRKQENGRSMIEMLGVLAIIGVLSVGGIAGYTTAMRSHRANEIVNATSMLFMLGLAQNAGEGTGTLTFDTAFGTSMRPSGCGGITYKGDKATLDVNIEDETICKQVKTKLGDKAGDCTAATGGTTGYTLTVTLGEEGGDTFTCNPTCENGQVYINGFCEDKAVCENGDYYFMRQNKCISEIYCENTEHGTGIIDYNAITCDFSCNNGYHLIFDEWGGISCVSDATNS